MHPEVADKSCSSVNYSGHSASCCASQNIYKHVYINISVHASASLSVYHYVCAFKCACAFVQTRSPVVYLEIPGYDSKPV